jgi:hypothetical protein
VVVVKVVAVAAGVAVVIATLLSAVRTFVVPRGTPILLTRAVFRASRWLFMLASRRATTYEDRDHVMASYAPLTLVTLPAVWLSIVALGYTAMFWGIGLGSLRAAFRSSGSSLFTLGFAAPDQLPPTILAFSEATVGLGLLALLLAYLPAMYTAFSRREAAVAMMEVRAGSPPTPEELLRRAWVIGWTDRLPGLWESWQEWFIDVEETHTSLAALSFFRSPVPQRSWVTAAGCVLDTAAVRCSALDLPRESEAELCIRTGYLALRRIADYFGIAYDPDPRPDDPISIGRDEFDGVVDRLAGRGLPVRADRDQAWADFVGWRVNYDVVLLSLAGLVMAPPSPWSSDRSPAYRPPPLRGRRHRRRPPS